MDSKLDIRCFQPAMRFLCTALLCLSFAGQPASAQNKGEEWVLDQKSDEVGDIIIHVMHDAAKVTNPLWGYNLVCKAPDWQVHCFRDKGKSEWVGDLHHFNGAMINSPFRTGDANPGQCMVDGKGVLKGMKYTRYANQPHSIAALYGADEIAVAPQIADFLSRLHDAPNCGKVPIYRSRIKNPDLKNGGTKGQWSASEVGRDLRSGFVIDIMTRSCKKIPANPGDFVLPTGCKRENKIDHVAYSSRQKEQLNEIFDEGNMGFASDGKGHEHKRPVLLKNSP